jgi:hypothetical protein
MNGTYFSADKFVIKNACEKALESINKAREAKLREAVISLCDEVNKSSFFSRLKEKFGGAKKRTYTVQELMEDKDLLYELDRRNRNVYVIFSKVDWAKLYAEQAKETCNRLIACCAACDQLYVSAEDWDVVYYWSKKQE